VTLAGPQGSGVSRLLDEMDVLVRGEGGPPLLRLRPVPEGRRPMTCLRAALKPLLRAPRGLGLERELRRLLPGSPDPVRVLAGWLADDEPPGPDAGPSPELVRELLSRVVPAGPVLVDDLDEIDEGSLSVLLPSVRGQGPGVLAGTAGPSLRRGAGPVWSLDPLSAAQVELLLRRWLHHAVTARRLASVLAERCGGWPGRVVAAVRALGRRGLLKRQGRGVVMARAPARWPDGTAGPEAFLEWARNQGAPALRVLDVASVHGEPAPAETLAEAAGVKPRFVRAMLEEAAAARGGVAPGRFFATRAACRAWAGRLSDTRGHAARLRLAALASRDAPPAGAGCPGAGLLANARQHEARAEHAHAQERPRAAHAHRARAARLHLAAGDLRAAASLLLDVAEQAVRRGRLSQALAALERAGSLHHLHGDPQQAAEVWFRHARVLGWLDAHDRALPYLQAALAAAEAGGHGRFLPRVHLALAGAYRACGDLSHERHHAELAAALASTALARIQASAVLARADLRAGVPGAEGLLERCEADLRTAGFQEEADRARAALVDARLRAGDPARAAEILPPGPRMAVERLAEARLHLAAGRSADACTAFELLGSDAALPADLRAACYAHLADALRCAGRLSEARAAAVAAAALLQVRGRNRADDARLHGVLARVFRSVGEPGRYVGHRSAARRGVRSLLRAVRDPRARRRLVRSVWRPDPRPGRRAS
jgi:hypothetical protein